MVNVDGCHDSCLDFPGRTINHTIVFDFAPIAFDFFGSNASPMIGNLVAVSECIVLPDAFGEGMRCYLMQVHRTPIVGEDGMLIPYLFPQVPECPMASFPLVVPIIYYLGVGIYLDATLNGGYITQVLQESD